MGKILQFSGSDRNRENAANARDGVLDRDVFHTRVGRVEMILRTDHMLYVLHDGDLYATGLHIPTLIDQVGSVRANMMLNDIVGAFVANEMLKREYDGSY